MYEIRAVVALDIRRFSIVLQPTPTPVVFVTCPEAWTEDNVCLCDNCVVYLSGSGHALNGLYNVIQPCSDKHTYLLTPIAITPSVATITCGARYGNTQWVMCSLWIRWGHRCLEPAVVDHFGCDDINIDAFKNLGLLSDYQGLIELAQSVRAREIHDTTMISLGTTRDHLHVIATALNHMTNVLQIPVDREQQKLTVLRQIHKSMVHVQHHVTKLKHAAHPRKLHKLVHMVKRHRNKLQARYVHGLRCLRGNVGVKRGHPRRAQPSSARRVRYCQRRRPPSVRRRYIPRVASICFGVVNQPRVARVLFR
jgi:hypothetical protein